MPPPPLMSRAVIAMRMRVAFLRHRMALDHERLLADDAYAAEVLKQCRALNQPELVSLAEQFIASKDGQPTAGTEATDAAAPPSATRATPRMRPASPPAEGSGSGDSLPPSSSMVTVLNSGAPSEPTDPDDPDKPRRQRYLRGAR